MAVAICERFCLKVCDSQVRHVCSTDAQCWAATAAGPEGPCEHYAPYFNVASTVKHFLWHDDLCGVTRSVNIS